uniref:Sporangia induced TRP protein putative n=1 Tax=Albugo laibachii Nc14 TaxID=890382 RepID=F0WBV6_9STRA|nr:sporangia induced TRP protein putative [Albugo laibachii Nc14]|eukprot:CCA18634.1 sporangia induced TRP protein putative [Albugo laibachii Nc14]
MNEMSDYDMIWSQVDPLYLSLLRYRQRRFDESVTVCTTILAQSPNDQAVWITKTRALTQGSYVDDTELEVDGASDLLMDDNALAAVPRPGTSLSRPSTQLKSQASDSCLRPTSSAGRPLTGFSRPGTNSRPNARAMTVDEALQGTRPGTCRATTSFGRQIRPGTASIQTEDQSCFIDVDQLDLKRYASRPLIAKILVDYILYHARNPRRALELASEATVACNYKDWWWKARLGKCYYHLGLFRDAEKQISSALRNQEMMVCYLELCKVYLRMDQPNKTLEYFETARQKYPQDVNILLGIARVNDMLQDFEQSTACYKEVLKVEACNVEAIACLASNYFYTDHPEIAVGYYRRLLQMGINTAELWCNIGLCCFYASLYDMTLSCFDRALFMASDDCMADIWYNIGHVAIGIGDFGLAYQAFKIALSADSNHAEAFNNLGVLEIRKGNAVQAQSNFVTADILASYLYEPSFNRALLAYTEGNFQKSYVNVNEALRRNASHSDSIELKKHLQSLLVSV